MPKFEIEFRYVGYVDVEAENRAWARAKFYKQLDHAQLLKDAAEGEVALDVVGIEHVGDLEV
jgi:hypothetical protein